MGDSKQLQVYNRGFSDVIVTLSYQSILTVLDNKRTPGITRFSFISTFRFHPALLDFAAYVCYEGTPLTTTIMEADRASTERMLMVRSRFPLFLLNVQGLTRTTPRGQLP